MKTHVTLHSNLFDFFNERVEVARNQLSDPISDDTALYLSSLLSEKAIRAPDTFRTLAELHGEAALATPGIKASLYRQLGDHALYVLGYFREHLERSHRAIGPDYYKDMGSAAYLQCDQVLKRWFSDAFGPVFTELSQHFDGCVQIVRRVRSDDNGSLDHFYREWSEALPENSPVHSTLFLPIDPTES